MSSVTAAPRTVTARTPAHRLSTAAFALLLGAFAGHTLAQSSLPGVDQGIASGTLTARGRAPRPRQGSHRPHGEPGARRRHRGAPGAGQKHDRQGDFDRNGRVDRPLRR